MAIATATIGAAGGAAKFFEGKKMMRTGQEAIDNFNWQDLGESDPYGDTQVSTLGADLRTEQEARRQATTADALRTGGTRGLLGGLGKSDEKSMLVQADIAAGLDEQQKALDLKSAEDKVLKRAMIEKRQGDELAGYGQMMNVGLGLKNQGITDVMNTAGFLAQTDMGKSVDGSIESIFKVEQLKQ